MNGKYCKSIVNEFLQADIYETHLNSDALASGVYYYRINTLDYSYSKKMIILK